MIQLSAGGGAWLELMLVPFWLGDLPAPLPRILVGRFVPYFWNSFLCPVFSFLSLRQDYDTPHGLIYFSL